VPYLDIDPSSAPREKYDNGSFGGRGFSKGMWDYILDCLRKTKVFPSCQQFGDFRIFEAILLVECQASDPKDLHLKMCLVILHVLFLWQNSISDMNTLQYPM
jgi:hypothetical protein